MLNAANHYLEDRGIRIGTRDAEMHQTRKDKQWYFGVEARIGVDSKEGIVHSLCSTATSEADKAYAVGPVGRRGAQGAERRSLSRAGRGDPQSRTARPGHDLAADQSVSPMMPNTSRSSTSYNEERTGLRPGCGPSLKRFFGFVKVRFRGLKKNHDHLCGGLALVNLYMHRKRLAPLRRNVSGKRQRGTSGAEKQLPGQPNQGDAKSGSGL
jgi:IS5 family transposase